MYYELLAILIANNYAYILSYLLKVFAFGEMLTYMYVLLVVMLLFNIISMQKALYTI